MRFRPRRETRALPEDQLRDQVTVSSLNMHPLQVFLGGIRGYNKFATAVGADGIELTHPRFTRLAWQLHAAGITEDTKGKRSRRFGTITSTHAGWGAKNLTQLKHGNQPDPRWLSLFGSVLLSHRDNVQKVVKRMEQIVGRKLPTVMYPENEEIYGEYGLKNYKELRGNGASEVLYQLKPKMQWVLSDVHNPELTAQEISRQAREKGLTGLCADIHHAECWVAEQGINDETYLPRMLQKFAELGDIKRIHVGVNRLLDDGRYMGVVMGADGKPVPNKAGAKEHAQNIETKIRQDQIGQTSIGKCLDAINEGLLKLDAKTGKKALFPTIVLEYPAGILATPAKIRAANTDAVTALRGHVTQYSRQAPPHPLSTTSRPQAA